MKSVREKLGQSAGAKPAPQSGHMTAAEFKAQRPDRKARRVVGASSTKGEAWVRRSRPEDRTIEGITFDSKAEAFRFVQLRGMVKRGEILGFVRQPVLDLAGVVFKPDFLIWARNNLGEVVVYAEDTKGKGTHPEVMRRFRRNQVQAERLYGFPVVLVEIDS